MLKHERSALMARIKSKNTTPELKVRRLLFSLGYRYRLHAKALPGKPDIVFIGRRKVIFVHGCFWHAHTCKRGFKPKTNIEFWNQKLNNNKLRDNKVMDELAAQGWKTLTIWECELAAQDVLEQRLHDFLKA